LLKLEQPCIWNLLKGQIDGYSFSFTKFFESMYLFAKNIAMYEQKHNHNVAYDCVFAHIMHFVSE
jgi:hypothetical protein